MNNSPNFLNSIKPEIRNLNVRTISKMIASKIITTTELQLQREPNFCKILNVAQHLTTYEAVTYFVDNQFFEEYGFQQLSLIRLQDIYDQLLLNFYEHLRNTIYYPEVVPHV